ncbi:MAG: preprotein translocase subunit YajC [Andreesenia angusta]|nr:preprotein translocase subunit YajC [Andreesenia angusta]
MPAGGAAIIQSLLVPILLLAFFYFAIIRPNKNREKKLSEMRNALKAGDKIITIGGIVGRVASVKEDDVNIEVGSDRTRFTIKKWAISTVEEKESLENK